MAHQPHQHGSSPALPFTPAEVELFHAEDRKAATAIIGLMTGIFTIGVCLYLIVCYSIS